MEVATFLRRLRNGLTVVSTRPEHAEQLEELQRIVFPTLVDTSRFKAPHYRKHVALFPEGQFVVLDGDRVVGMTSTIRLDLDGAHGRTFADIIQGGWLTSHDPQGEWLYGADIGTHPQFRGQGVARALYAARHDTVRRLRLRGQATEGMISGYGAVKDEVTAEEYYADLVAGRIQDPTVSAQMHIGFEPRGLLRGYLEDPVCDDCCVTLVLDAAKDVAADWEDA